MGVWVYSDQHKGPTVDFHYDRVKLTLTSHPLTFCRQRSALWGSELDGEDIGRDHAKKS